MVEGEILSAIESFDKKNISVATIGSHSALNIFIGAKEEGLSTVCVCQRGREKIYEHYGLVDEFIMVDDLHDILRPEIQDRLKKLNSIVIPHGSFNAYIDQDQMTEEFKVPVFGNRTLMQYEVSREKQHKWLREAGLKVPYIYNSIEDITGLAFVKFPGAKGGKGYFVVDSPDAFEEKIQYMVDRGLLTPEEACHPYVQE
ncbi:MAG: DUF1246 domain-containing protein, partial [Candidatus Altiarchaeales archaeon]|nr:DUF1246 domain-containing protein [Candidatus Altiarchaeales archaeon]